MTNKANLYRLKDHIVYIGKTRRETRKPEN